MADCASVVQFWCVPILGLLAGVGRNDSFVMHGNKFLFNFNALQFSSLPPSKKKKISTSYSFKLDFAESQGLLVLLLLTHPSSLNQTTRDEKKTYGGTLLLGGAAAIHPGPGTRNLASRTGLSRRNFHTFPQVFHGKQHILMTRRALLFGLSIQLCFQHHHQ